MARYSLCCGINSYDKDAFRSLSFGINDAVRMDNLLSLCGYETEILLGERLRDTSFENAIKARVNRMVSGDFLLFYFSGHGCCCKGTQYVLPHNAVFDGQQLSNGLNLGEIAKLTDKPGIQRLFVVDACRDLFHSKSSRRKTDYSLTEKGITNLVTASSLRSKLGILCACSDGEVSYESNILRGGVFTSAMIEVIIAQLDEGKQISLFDIIKDVESRLRELSQRISETFPSQSPWVFGSNLILIEGRSSSSNVSDFLSIHKDVLSEFSTCDVCGHEMHYLDVRRCDICGLEMCSSHFSSEEESVCACCKSIEPDPTIEHDKSYMHEELLRREHTLVGAFEKLVPSGVVLFTTSHDWERFVYELGNELLSSIPKMDPQIPASSGIRRDMTIEAYYGFSSVDIGSSVASRGHYTHRDHDMLCKRSIDKLKDIMLYGRKSDIFAIERKEMGDIGIHSRSLESKEEVRKLYEEREQELAGIFTCLAKRHFLGKSLKDGVLDVFIYTVIPFHKELFYQLGKSAGQYLNIDIKDEGLMLPLVHSVFGVTPRYAADFYMLNFSSVLDGEYDRIIENFKYCLRQAFRISKDKEYDRHLG